MAVTRVAIDIGSQLTPRTGVGVAVHHLVDALRALDDPPELLPYTISFRTPPPEGTRRLPFPAAAAHRWWGRHASPACDRWLGRTDVVHGTNYVVPPAAAARLVSVYDCWFLLHPDDVEPAVNLAAKALRRAARDGVTIHTSSIATAEAARKLLGTDRIEVIPLGAIPVPPPPDDMSCPVAGLNGRPFVLALGTIEQRKNLPRLVEAFEMAAAAVADVMLVLAGASGNDQSAVDRAIDALPAEIASRVLVPGRVSDLERAWLLHHADALAYPSLDEGFGFPLLEAMGAGVPVVASTAGSIPEVAGRAAILVDPYDTLALADGLTRALLDSEGRSSMITEGHRRVAAHSWADTARRMAELYDRLAKERR